MQQKGMDMDSYQETIGRLALSSGFRFRKAAQLGHAARMMGAA